MKEEEYLMAFFDFYVISWKSCCVKSLASVEQKNLAFKGISLAIKELFNLAVSRLCAVTITSTAAPKATSVTWLSRPVTSLET